MTPCNIWRPIYTSLVVISALRRGRVDASTYCCLWFKFTKHQADQMRLLTKTVPRGFEITSLPQDIFLMILSYLCYIDVIYCRRVSRSWNAAFGNPFNLYTFLKWTFPFAREVRRYHQEKLLDNEHGIPPHDNHWRELFDNISARYFHLHVGRPQSIERYKIWPNYTQNIRTGSRLFPVPPWEAHSSIQCQSLIGFLTIVFGLTRVA